MGNTRSASFVVDHLPGDVTPTRQSRKQFSYTGEEESDLESYKNPRPHSMPANLYAESSVSENSSKESETMSTLSSTSTAENIPSLADRYKTAPSRIFGPETGHETDSRKTKSMQNYSGPESFFDAIFATIEQEAGKRSPNLPRRGAQTIAKKKWSGMLS